MAIRLSMAFGGSAESWMIQQGQFDLWQAKQKAGNIKVKRFAA
jgi:plasmid maintenance system antidote protein VapI